VVSTRGWSTVKALRNFLGAGGHPSRLLRLRGTVEDWLSPHVTPGYDQLNQYAQVVSSQFYVGNFPRL
jgi:hypothetical protein